MMPSLRAIAVVLLVASATLLSLRAVAEPLDKNSCTGLKDERKKLLTPEMQSALDKGPDWVKNHLNPEEIERVRAFLMIEEKIEFRCRGGGVIATPNAFTVPLPDRNPNRPPTANANANAKPSQTVADSDNKTAPDKPEATR